MVPLANAGTPLMWAGCCALLFGNVLLGMFETWLIRDKTKLIRPSAIPIVLANYVSMLAGVAFSSSPLLLVTQHNRTRSVEQYQSS